jgi:hypothetical protein
MNVTQWTQEENNCKCRKTQTMKRRNASGRMTQAKEITISEADTRA